MTSLEDYLGPLAAKLPKRNYVDPERVLYDSSHSIVTCVLSLVVPAFVTWILRCGVRISRGAWGVDDTCMTLAAPFFAWLSASCLSAAWHGIGAKDIHLTGGVHQQTQALKDFFMFEISYCIAVLLIKLSIALTLMRIASKKPLFVWIIKATIVLFSVVIIMVCLYILFECQPIRYAWDKTIDGHCQPAEIITAMSFTLSATNILTDWTCALLPIPLLWTLEMNRNSKIAAGILLSFGVFASVCALIRLQYTIGLTATEDYFYHTSFVLLWAYAEVGVGMTAGNCSTLRPIFSKVFILSSSFSSGRGSGGGQGDGSASGWFFGSSRARRDGAIELEDADFNPERKGGCRVETTVAVDSRGQSTTRIVEESSLEDDESARQILRASGSRRTGGGGITVIRHMEHNYDTNRDL